MVSKAQDIPLQMPSIYVLAISKTEKKSKTIANSVEIFLLSIFIVTYNPNSQDWFTD